MTLEKLSTKEILHQNLSRNVPERLNELKILLHDVRSMHNIGAAFRCADAFGIRELMISGFSPVPPRPEITKTAIGAEKYVFWRHIADVEKEAKKLKKNGYLLIGLEQTNKSVMLPDYVPAPKKKICLTFGNEVTGLSDEVLSLIDTFIEIPQYGHKHSLNVSVTVGVALYAFLQKFWSTNK